MSAWEGSKEQEAKAAAQLAAVELRRAPYATKLSVETPEERAERAPHAPHVGHIVTSVYELLAPLDAADANRALGAVRILLGLNENKVQR